MSVLWWLSKQSFGILTQSSDLHPKIDKLYGHSARDFHDIDTNMLQSFLLKNRLNKWTWGLLIAKWLWFTDHQFCSSAAKLFLRHYHFFTWGVLWRRCQYQTLCTIRSSWGFRFVNFANRQYPYHIYSR